MHILSNFFPSDPIMKMNSEPTRKGKNLGVKKGTKDKLLLGSRKNAEGST